MSTCKVEFYLSYQLVLVPVGRISLVRIFNVAGSVVDEYLELSLSLQHNRYCLTETHQSVESMSSTAYALGYEHNAIFGKLRIYSQHQIITSCFEIIEICLMQKK